MFTPYFTFSGTQMQQSHIVTATPKTSSLILSSITFPLFPYTKTLVISIDYRIRVFSPLLTAFYPPFYRAHLPLQYLKTPFQLNVICLNQNVSELKQARGSLLKATDRGLKLFFRHFHLFLGHQIHISTPLITLTISLSVTSTNDILEGQFKAFKKYPSILRIDDTHFNRSPYIICIDILPHNANFFNRTNYIIAVSAPSNCPLKGKRS